MVREVDGLGDSDWAGCRVTGKSTSGGVLMIGDHWIKGWSRTQKSITLSSAEAELVAMVKVTAEAIGVSNLGKDWGRERKVVVYADSAAALGITDRRLQGQNALRNNMTTNPCKGHFAWLPLSVHVMEQCV